MIRVERGTTLESLPTVRCGADSGSTASGHEFNQTLFYPADARAGNPGAQVTSDEQAPVEAKSETARRGFQSNNRAGPIFAGFSPRLLASLPLGASACWVIAGLGV